jgi:hypothetical protein
VEVACQAGVCYYSLDLLEDKATQLKMGSYDTLSDTDKKKVIDSIEQEYLAYLFLNNSNAKMHSQLKKDVANDYSKGNTNAYPNDIHKALTLMNEYKPLKLDTPAIPVQGTAFVTKDQGGKKKGKGKTKYLNGTEWNALSPEAQSKIIEARKKGKDDYEDEKSVASNKSSKTIKSLSKTMKLLEKDNQRLKKSVSALQKCDEDEDSSLSSVEGSSHFQDAMEMLEEHHPKLVLALKSSKFTNLDLRNVLLLDNQSTFDLCCNKMFAFKIIKAENALSMTSNGGGLKITEKCKIPGYKYLVWYSKKAITNIICLKNLIKCY